MASLAGSAMPWRDQPAAGVVDVADRRPPRLEAVLLVPGVAIAGRAAVIGLKHGIAAIGEKLGEPVEAPFVARARAAMRHDDGREVLAAAARRQGQIGGDLGAVRGPVGDRLHRRERDVLELRAAPASARRAAWSPCRTDNSGPRRCRSRPRAAACSRRRWNRRSGSAAGRAGLGQRAAERRQRRIEIDRLRASRSHRSRRRPGGRGRSGPRRRRRPGDGR